MKQYLTSNSTYVFIDPETKQQVLKFYYITQPETQEQFLTRDEEIVPKTNLDNIITYAPIRNIHTYPIMEHGDRY